MNDQLQLFTLPENFNVIPLCSPLFEPDTMDILAGIKAMGWRSEIERRNFELMHKPIIRSEVCEVK